MVDEDDELSVSSFDDMDDTFKPKKVPFAKGKAIKKLSDSTSNTLLADSSSSSSSERTSDDDSSIKKETPKQTFKSPINPYLMKRVNASKFFASSTYSDESKHQDKSETIERHRTNQTPDVDCTPNHSPASIHMALDIVSTESGRPMDKLSADQPELNDLLGNVDFPWFNPDDITTDHKDSIEPNNTVAVVTKGIEYILCEDFHDPIRKTNAETDIQEVRIPRKHQQDLPMSAAESSPFRQGRVSEVDPVLYAPLPYQEKSKPRVHYLSEQNRPLHARKNLPINQFFDNPVNLLWKSKYDTFNPLQSEVANVLAYSNDNIVVSAPTGSGKTCIFEMAMAKLFAATLHAKSRNHKGITHQLPKHRKIVYIAPSKALCDERFEDWSRRFSDMNLGIQCAMVTGDVEPGDCYRDIATAHMILTTPEKWDSITRRWTENFFLIASVKLLLIDEVHLLGDSSRGCCLESIVCRMKTVFRATQNSQSTDAQILSSSYSNTTPEAISSYLRIIAVSATLPNVSDIAAFLDANEAFAFDASFRPVPLTIHTIGFHGNDKNLFLFNKNLNNRIPDLIHRFSKGKPTIIFCHTKRECEVLASELSVAQGIGRQGDQGRINAAGQTRIKSLQKVLHRGVGYHHAGLEACDRKTVEKAFGDCVRVLCATSTLAMGVNLPAHLVIIKGTLAWRGADEGYSEIDPGTMLQMMGRAGRPGFDTEGIAVIMTDAASKHRYDRLSAGLETVESQMPAKLLACLNSEISQQVIASFADAMNWIKGTFYFTRAQCNPANYGIKGDQNSLELALTTIVGQALRDLDIDGFISVNKDNGAVSPLAGSTVMSSHLVEYKAMKKIAALPFDTTQSQLVMTIAEFDHLHRPVRRSEKKVLNELHKTIRYKLDGPVSKVRVQQPWQKTFVLLQAAVGQQYLEDYTLRQEMSMMVDFAARMLVAIEEFSIEGSMHGQVALQCLRLRRSFSSSLWGVRDGALNQLSGVGADVTAKLRFNKIISFADTVAATEEAIERAAGKPPPFGKDLRGAAGKILRNTLQLSVSVDTRNQRLICKLSKRSILGVSHRNESSLSDDDVVKYSLVSFTDRPGGSLQYISRVFPDREYQCALPTLYGEVFVLLVANLVGLDEKVVIDGNDEINPSTYTQTPMKVPVPLKSAPNHGSRTNQKQQTLHDTLLVDNSLRKRCRTMHVANSSIAAAKRMGSQHTKKSNPRHDSLCSTIPSPNRIEHVSYTSIGHIASAVTPSPRHAYTIPAPVLETIRAVPAGVEYQRSQTPSMREGSTAVTTNQSTWNKEKREQRNFQQSAFVAEKENPFSRFKFDPNDVESNLEALASRQAQQQADNSIIPLNVLLQLPPKRRMNDAIGRSGTFGIRNAGRATRFGSSRAKRYRGVQTRSNEELLHMKAEEQNRLRFLPVFNAVSVASYGAPYGSPAGNTMMQPSSHAPQPPSQYLLTNSQPWCAEQLPLFQGQLYQQSPKKQNQIQNDPWCGFENENNRPFHNGSAAFMQHIHVPQPSTANLGYSTSAKYQHRHYQGMWSQPQGQLEPEHPSVLEMEAGENSFDRPYQAATDFGDQLVNAEEDDTLLDFAFF